MAYKIGDHSGVYQIRCLRDGKVYIGSAVDFRVRWGEHRFHLNRGSHHCRHLQSAWKKHGPEAFVFEILERIKIKDKVELLRLEQEYLDRVKPWKRGVGYNVRPKAESPLGMKHSPETRAKLREIKLNQSPETLAKIAAAHRGMKRSAESRARMSAAAKNRTPEHREKLAAATRGRKLSPEHRAKVGAALKGKKRSPETVAKVAAAHRGMKRSAEFCARMSAARKGKRLSPEHAAKVAAAGRATLAAIRRKPSAAQLTFDFGD